MFEVHFTYFMTSYILYIQYKNNTTIKNILFTKHSLIILFLFNTGLFESLEVEYL